MAFTVTNTFTTGTPVVAADVNQNFDDVESLLNAGLTTANLNASAGITNGQLANDDFEFVLGIQLDGTELLKGTTGFIVVGAVPYDSTGGTGGYTILGIEHMTYAVTGGLTAAVFTLNYGNHTDGFTAIKTGITTGTASGQTRETGFTSTIAISATRPNFFVLDVTTAGVTWALVDSWQLSIKLKRTNGLRA
jgi:hypothetical protein